MTVRHSALGATGPFDPPSRARRAIRWVATLGCAAGLLVAPAALASKVKGRVVNFTNLRNPVWEEAKDPKGHGYSFRELVPTVPSHHRQLYPHIPKELCIAVLGQKKVEPPKPILIRVGGGRTTPVTIVVPPGTQLSFKNTDPFTHRLYGKGISTFKAADTASQRTRDWTVPKAGTFEIRDELAPSLRFWVIAEEKVVTRVYPSMNGEFVAVVKEPGEYTVQAYFAGKPAGDPRKIEVGPRDSEIKDPIKVAPDKNKDDDDKGDEKAEKKEEK